MADLSKVNNAGQYFSVDGRPLSTARGIGRDITKRHKAYLRAAASGEGSHTPITDPFLCLHVNCPQGTYDVNIEPAKDDILFENPQSVLSMVEGLFRDTYGELAGSNNLGQTSTNGKEKAASKDGFELLLARKSPDTTPQRQSPEKRVSSASLITPPIFKSPVPSNSRRANGHEEERHQEESPARSETQAKAGDSLNPWVLTRMNTWNRQPHKSHLALNENPRFSMPTMTEEPLERRRNSRESGQQYKDSPLTSPKFTYSHSTSASPSELRHSPSPLQASPHLSTTSAPGSANKAARERDRERYGNGAIDTWFERTTRPALQQAGSAEPEHENAEPSLTQLAATRFGSQEQRSSNPPGASVQDSASIRMGSGAIAEPLSQGLPVSAMRKRLPEAESSSQGLPTPEESPCRRLESSASLNTTGLDEALEFEQRKKEAIQKRREQMRARNEVPSSTASPHQSRYLAAKAALSSDCNPAAENQSISPVEKNPPILSLSHGDPRTYFMHQQSVQQENGQPRPGMKLQRTQTKKLPLEKIPEGYDLHGVSMIIPARMSLLSGSFARTSNPDLYTRGGTDFQAFLAPHSEDVFHLWETRLTELTKSAYRTEDGSQVPNLQFDFSAIRHFGDFEASASKA